MPEGPKSGRHCINLRGIIALTCDEVYLGVSFLMTRCIEYVQDVIVEKAGHICSARRPTANRTVRRLRHRLM
ncbi:MAG: hypothetical protein K0S45_1475 [Nitrospira sp.]|jgi:hypothetical protein|nr:hypothetical protein [Nitrospira sp.]